MAGVTPQGFESKTLAQIIGDLEQKQRDQISPTINTSTEAIVGQLNGVFGSSAREIWEVLAAVDSAASILSATGIALDRKVALTATRRNAAQFSTVLAQVELEAGASLPAGSEASVVDNPDAVFQSDVAISNGGGSTATFDVLMTSTEPGAVRANAGTLTVISTPVVGWLSVDNAADAVEGAPIESDSALLTRYLATASGQGLSPIDSIQASVDAVPNVLQTRVFENTLDVVNAGMAPHSVEAVVVASIFNDDAIAQAIWDSKAGGIGTSGGRSGNALDSNGDNQIVNYSEATQISAHVRTTIAVDQNFDPADGPTGLAEALADWGDAALRIGNDLVVSQLTQPIFDFGGVRDIVNLEVSDDGVSWQDTNLIAAPREIVDLDTGRIQITTQPYTDLDA